MCAPCWDDDAVFSSLIGGRGSFAITPNGRFVWGGHYEDHGLIWRSRWVTDSGIVECREALAFPGDRHRVVVLRRVIAVRGAAQVQMFLEPAAGFGRHGMVDAHRDDTGCWHARVGDLWMRLAGAPDARLTEPEHGAAALETTLTLSEGAHHDFVFELADTVPADGPPEPELLWDATETAWSRAIPAFDASIAPRDARLSYAVMRGLTGARGGMVAAATMSLPERAEQDRNYDYRYAWIRDQCYAGQAVAVDGPHPLLDDAVRFVTERLLADGSDLRPAYTVNGGAVPGERRLQLPGYPGGTDMVGNHVNTQFQLDIFGEVLLLFAAAADHDHLDGQGRQAVNAAVAAIMQRWHEPDAGIWELDKRRWAHSRLVCAAGLRAIAGHASAAEAAQWSALADAIIADAADCRHPTGRWQRAPGDARVDAALLLPALRGALPATDPRSLATLAAVGAELSDEFYVYRFRQDARPLHEAEGAFVLCGFLMALAAHQQGDAVGAARYFERNRAACGPPGLFSEEYDVVQRQLRGNLPQAFVHALMLESSLRLAAAPTEGT
jgi:GH15 family glucan-1,4-alpha-glucosidase